ncbi:MAG TPA: tRNA uridine-5-carboxymethylaminomethyl(34) synthesis GTPase MnmE, partial [Gemmatimonadaceae bacterium]|nr:tRNA uridine-5-carboxymethylaminomethyl(34) synthesis GTPase MnmE [Gemmatimonadaceae bacterium]
MIGNIDDTIVSISTASGRAAVALIRLSGPRALAIAARHITPWNAEPRRAHLATVHQDGEPLDQALITVFPGPDSFTGDDVVEISTHGGMHVPASVVAVLIASGARQAQPGEFTRRAVINGKLDILQAEAIGDLIDAHSHSMQRAALQQLDAGLSRRLAALREDLIGVEALIAYDIDFPEEDDGPVPREKVQTAVTTLAAMLDALLATAPIGELIREGAIVVIAGAPNVGKSSLFNALIGRSRAIVTEIPGTTRDAIEAVVDSGNWPLRLVDTAGLRDTEDTIERIGIAVSERYLAAAHIVLACSDSDTGIEQTAGAIAEKSAAPLVKVRTKVDLVASSHELGRDPDVVYVSAETGAGLAQLLAAIDRALEKQHGPIAPDMPMLTRARHRHA